MWTKLASAWLLVAALCAAATADDGIQLDVPFTVPYAVDGVLVVNRAEISKRGDQDAVLTIWYLSRDGKAIEKARYAIAKLHGPEPRPEPEPQPEPEPTPVAQVWGIIVEETAERTPQHAIVMNDHGFRALFDGRLRVVDDDTQSAQYQKYVERSRGRKLPQLFLVDEGGAVLFEGALPGSAAEAISLVKRFVKGD